MVPKPQRRNRQTALCPDFWGEGVDGWSLGEARLTISSVDYTKMPLGTCVRCYVLMGKTPRTILIDENL